MTLRKQEHIPAMAIDQGSVSSKECQLDLPKVSPTTSARAILR